jgi:hypothetical protein
MMAGGYGRDVAETVEVHLQTVAEARDYVESWTGAARGFQD